MSARFRQFGIVLSLLSAAIAGCSQDTGSAARLMVFAAASLNEVVTELGTRFERERGIRVEYNFAGSNALARQLLAAPVADLFISANEGWVQRLEQAGRISRESRKVVSSNRLVVIVNRASTLEAEPRELFCMPSFEYLSIANPEAVPAGIYARQWLQKLPCDRGSAWDAVVDRIAPAPNVRAALGLVEAERDIPGIVYATDAAMSEKVRVIREVTGELAPYIAYYAAIVASRSDNDSARQFLEFLGGDQAAEIFRHYGFRNPQALASE